MTQTNDHAGEPAVLVDKRGHAMWVTLNRPDKRNAINKDAVAGIRDGWRRAHADSDVRVIVLTAAGEKAFCPGGDLQPGAGFAFDLSQPNIDYADMLREVQNATLLASAGEPFVESTLRPLHTIFRRLGWICSTKISFNWRASERRAMFAG